MHLSKALLKVAGQLIYYCFRLQLCTASHQGREPPDAEGIQEVAAQHVGDVATRLQEGLACDGQPHLQRGTEGFVS